MLHIREILFQQREENLFFFNVLFQVQDGFEFELTNTKKSTL